MSELRGWARGAMGGGCATRKGSSTAGRGLLFLPLLGESAFNEDDLIANQFALFEFGVGEFLFELLDALFIFLDPIMHFDLDGGQALVEFDRLARGEILGFQQLAALVEQALNEFAL